MSPPVRPSRFRGAALITALLVVALATTAAVALATRQALELHRTRNLLAADQAAAYAVGVENWVQVILARDRNDGTTDHLGEVWATQLPPMEVTGGYVSGWVEDLQGRLNLNALLVEGKPDPVAVARLERLLALLELEPALVQALLDWMDPDIQARFPEGAEDDFYLGLDPPYRAANRPLVSISELALVRGFSAEAIARLTPHVSALPATAGINVNTAGPLVLRALAAGLTETDAESLAAMREAEDYEHTLAEFQQAEALAGRESFETAGLTDRSDHFLVHADVGIGDTRVRLNSWLVRAEQGSRVRRRNWGTE